MRLIGTLKATWWFTVKVYEVDYHIPHKANIPGKADVQALHSGRFWGMQILIEKWYWNNGDVQGQLILWHELKHALDKSAIWLIWLSLSRLEKRARAYVLKKHGDVLPWV